MTMKDAGTPRIRRAIAVGTFLAAVAVGTGVFVHERDTARQIPSSSAAPEKVLRVYLRAAKTHDCSVTERLTDAGKADPSMAWCGGISWWPVNNHPDLLSYRNIGPANARPGSDADGSTELCYPVDITETNMSGASPGPLPGWRFCLTETAAGWRLSDEGYG